MIYNAMSHILQRDFVISYIKENKFKRIADLGGVLGPWAKEVVTHYIDLQDFENSYMKNESVADEAREKPVIHADMSNPFTWTEVEKEINENGKFDFVICTQCIEHSGNPEITIRFLEMLSNEGFVSVPNKKVELMKGIAHPESGLKRCGFSDFWRGFLPHKWIYTIRDSVLWAFPKLNFLEYLISIDEVASTDGKEPELSFMWKENIPIKVIGDEFLDFPDPKSACEFYTKELKIGI